MTNIKRYDLVKIGSRIKEERKALGLSQTEFAERLAKYGCNVGRNTMSTIEKGQPTEKLSIDMLASMCAIFGCQIGYLLCEPEYKDRTALATDICAKTGLTQYALTGLHSIQHVDSLNSKDFILWLLDPERQPIPKGYPFNMDMLNLLLSDYSVLNNFLQVLTMFCTTDSNDKADEFAMSVSMYNSFLKLKETHREAINDIVNKYHNMDTDTLKALINKI